MRYDNRWQGSSSSIITMKNNWSVSRRRRLHRVRRGRWGDRGLASCHGLDIGWLGGWLWLGYRLPLLLPNIRRQGSRYLPRIIVIVPFPFPITITITISTIIFPWPD
jgi:hypothetical protein